MAAKAQTRLDIGSMWHLQIPDYQKTDYPELLSDYPKAQADQSSEAAHLGRQVFLHSR